MNLDSLSGPPKACFQLPHSNEPGLRGLEREWLPCVYVACVIQIQTSHVISLTGVWGGIHLKQAMSKHSESFDRPCDHRVFTRNHKCVFRLCNSNSNYLCVQWPARRLSSSTSTCQVHVCRIHLFFFTDDSSKIKPMGFHMHILPRHSATFVNFRREWQGGMHGLFGVRQW